MRIRSLCLLFTLGIVLTLSSAGRAETFTASLSGAQEVPPVATTATGYARVFINEATGQLTFTVVFNGLSSNQTASHIHAPAAIGANVGVAINFGVVGGTSGTISGTTTVTPTQLAQIRQHLGYVNVHSVNFPGGEIRGQLGIKRPVDFDGDGRTDLSVLRFPNTTPPTPAPITWWNLNTTTGAVAANFGDANTDFPVPGDYDGDGRDDLCLFRSVAGQTGYWLYLTSTNTAVFIGWGVPGDRPVARDYDGDGITDIAVFRPGATSTAQTTWYIRNSSNGSLRVEAFGLTGTGTTFDTPIPGDYDGDGKFDIAVYRVGLSPANTFIVKRSSDGVVTFQGFGNFATDYIVPGDYDGDGKFDPAVARPGPPMVWWILQSSNNVTRAVAFGTTGDFPAQGDYDGDARTDVAIYRGGATDTSPSTFWVLRSFDNSVVAAAWGLGADFPTNTFDIR